MLVPSESNSLDPHEDLIFRILVNVFGVVPRLRGSTPLSAIGFQPAHAVILVHQAELAGLSFPSEIDFTQVDTVQDFAASCAPGGSSD